ncbi:hypothetical protein NC661_19775 [Aquibacillus koreensis]|uniref:Gram-positive cocci surface proteins LPxTG domain-containing protein n=1 Tax=Aquibacillus koreensis TaxID=279446 RepID=A0A9X3WRU1_9BACI|nr:sugar-binding protein [Aquibacillus koreensis]MCT2536077.1 hypothetical protein [Aquibacillus koreensis]MDC3422596.1 hypothetical protein [Aquibacillus koreensis]
MSRNQKLMFKRVFISFLVVILVVAPFQGVDSTVQAAEDDTAIMSATFGSPTVDGEIDELWNSVEPVTPTITSKETTTTGTFKTLWDDNAFYILAEISDEVLNDDSTAPYEQDSLEIFIDEKNDKTPSYQSDDLHFRINYENVRSADNGDINRFYTKTKVTDTGYIIEARIAFTEAPVNEKILGFELQINDAISGSRDATINLFDETGQAYADPSLFGEIQLTGKEEGDTTGINPFDLLAYLDYVEAINQDVFINGKDLIEPINAAHAVLDKEDKTQAEIDQALVDLEAVVQTLKRSEKYDEPHTLSEFEGLHDPFTFRDGSQVRTEADWNSRAEELRDLYQFYMYGYMPDTSGEEVSFEKTEDGMNITVKANGKEASFPVTVSLPGEDSEIDGPYPVIVALGGINSFWPPADYEAVANERGYAVVSFQPNDIAADNYTRNGAFFDLYPYSEVRNDVGALMAWGWGAGKVLDALEQNAFEGINAEKSVITGFSRYGKAALVTGAFDERFDVVNPHASGMGGMASFRASFVGKEYDWGTAGSHEGLGNLQGSTEGHWFNSVFGGFQNVKQIPFDQHLLSALVAPRSLILTSGYEDYGTNPEGMFVSYVGASKVYDFLDINDRIGVGFREGSHSRNDTDIDNLLDFADLQFRGMESEKDFKKSPYTIEEKWDTIVAPTKIADISNGMTAEFGSPAIDGDIDEVWNEILPVAPLIGADGTSTNGIFKTLWDDNALYVLAEINDEVLNSENTAPYMQDSIEIFLDELNDKAVSYQSDDLHFRVNHENVRSADNGDINRFYSKTKLTDTGYIVEARIALNEAPTNDSVMGLELQINEADDSSSRVATLNVFDTTGQAYANPSLFGEVKLAGKEDGDATEINPYDLLTYLEYVESINQDVFLNGSVLNGPIDAARDVLEAEKMTQANLDESLAGLKAVVQTLKRSEKFDEPHTLPEIAELPDPFTFMDGSKVTSKADWDRRAEELKDMYQFYMYGYMPDTSNEEVSFEKTDDGMTITVKANGKEASFPVTVSLPSEDVDIEGPYPVIVTLGGFSSFWAPNEFESQINDRGYAVVSLSPNDVAADNYTRTGAFYDLYPYSEVDNDVGALMAWAWGAGKVLDALEQNAYEAIDPDLSVITGFSRYGKAALVTGAFDERFDVVNPHASGMGGMASYRASFAGKEYDWGTAGSHEGLGNLQGSTEGHWFTSVFGGFQNVNQIPLDQHELAALVAPRSLILTSGYEDYGTNPEGMFVSYVGASKVYNFLDESNKVGLAFREGSHSRTEEDIMNLVDFADLQFRGIQGEKDFKDSPYTIDPAWDTIVAPTPSTGDGDGSDGDDGSGDGSGEDDGSGGDDSQTGDDQDSGDKDADSGDQGSDNGDTDSDSDDNDSTTGDKNADSDDDLPDTATNMYNWLAIGNIMLLLGAGYLLYARRKRA